MLTTFELIKYMWHVFCMSVIGLAIWSVFHWIIVGSPMGLDNFWYTIPFVFVLYVFLDSCKLLYRIVKEKYDK